LVKYKITKQLINKQLSNKTTKQVGKAVKSSEVAEPEKKERKRKKKKKKNKTKTYQIQEQNRRANGAWRDRAAAAAAVSRRKRCGEGWSGGDRWWPSHFAAGGFHRFRLSAFGFSLSLSDSPSLHSAIQKNLGFFCFVQARCTHTARGKFWIFFFFFLEE
jgi:hypothetical protein